MSKKPSLPGFIHCHKDDIDRVLNEMEALAKQSQQDIQEVTQFVEEYFDKPWPEVQVDLKRDEEFDSFLNKALHG